MPASPAQNDFHLTINRAANSILDASCAVRAARCRPLPQPHRRLVDSAIVHLERAQLDLFKACNDPWSPPKQLSHRQLELL